MRTLFTVTMIILMTATFGIAEGMATAAAGTEFPYFHLGALIIGGLTLLSLQEKYPKMWLSESIGSFALYTVLIALFTSPVAEFIRSLW